MKRLFSGTLAAISVVAVLLGLSMMDDRIGSQAQQLMNGQGLSPDSLSSVERAKDTLFMAISIAGDQSMGHLPLTIFALAAIALLLVMLRT
jgi:hypothetical protein